MPPVSDGLARLRGRRRRIPAATTRGTEGGELSLHLLVTVTFNDNQLRSHLLPLLALSEVRTVTLVADRPPPPFEKLRVVVPPRWLRRLCGRAGSKLLACLWIALRERPDWVIGFYFIPHGLNARIVSALTGAKSMYHMIGGEREWQGGGANSENRVLGRLPASSSRLERFLLRLISSCDAIATMGDLGRAILMARGIDPSRVHVIPPSVDITRFRSSNGGPRTYDVVTVGQLVPRKRTADLIRAVSDLRTRRPDIKVAIVGAGPLEAELRALAQALDLSDAVEFLGFRSDVEDVYTAARVFVLTSESEGLPIAMLEAMATGLPPVVSDVGEIGSFLSDSHLGLTFPAGDTAALSARVEALLDDESVRVAMGAAAAETVRDRVSVEAVAATYRKVLSGTGTAGRAKL
jgi:glycosyltransferase involved in cell wall biosynthesis